MTANPMPTGRDVDDVVHDEAIDEAMRTPEDIAYLLSDIDGGAVSYHDMREAKRQWRGEEDGTSGDAPKPSVLLAMLFGAPLNLREYAQVVEATRSWLASRVHTLPDYGFLPKRTEERLLREKAEDEAEARYERQQDAKEALRG